MNSMLNAFLALRALPWKAIGLGALALAFLALFVALKMERAHSAKLQSQVIACSEARKADRSAYEAAQAKAAADNLSHVRQVENQQRRINEETVSDLNARLERLRRELRSQGTAADQSPANGAGSSEGSGGPATPSEARLCFAPSVILRAAENEERHDQLITLVERLIANQE